MSLILQAAEKERDVLSPQNWLQIGAKFVKTVAGGGVGAVVFRIWTWFKDSEHVFDTVTTDIHYFCSSNGTLLFHWRIVNKLNCLK